MKLVNCARSPGWLLAIVLCVRSTGWAVTPADFGFGSIKVAGKPAQGGIPLLLITFDLATNNPPRLPLRSDANAVFDPLIFSITGYPSVNGYFFENSAGSFFWLRAGALGPVQLSPAETASLDSQQSADNGDGVNRTGLDCGAGIAYLLGLVAAKTGYDFTQWDANHDGTVSQNELSIVLIGNNDEICGANRPIGGASAGLAVPGQNVTLRGRVASLSHHTAFINLCHELSHSLGTKDLYNLNCWNSGLTLMSCTLFSSCTSVSAAPDDRRTFDLDPWHKIALGWVTPQIYSLNAGGYTTVSVPQNFVVNPPVILYDPNRGTSEYFIVEFRNSQTAAGSYDVNLADNAQQLPTGGTASGMAIWHVTGTTCPPGQTKQCPPVFHEGAPGLSAGGNTLWAGATPPLAWDDGTVTATIINPIRVGNGGYDLTFEWLTRVDTWVDFNYAGLPALPELGTIEAPFNTMVEGVNAAAYGGTLKIKPGSSAEALSIAKKIAIKAIGGAATIGK